MTTRITTNNIETTTLVQLISARITGIQVTNSSGTVLDDTAVDIAGGHIRITGSGFESGCQVVINNTPATSVTFVSATEVRAQLPATAAGTYIVYLVNPSGGVAIRVNGVTFSATPVWTTASTLPGGDAGGTISIQLAAAGAVTFSLAAGSSLPGTVTLSSGGLLSGTVPGVTNETTYNFSLVATDAELQDSPRSFSITITAGDAFFNSTTLLLPGNATTFVQDASVNNFAVTVTGDTRPNTFNPYLTGWSNFFDGSGDYLTTAASSLLGTPFTIEFYIYFNTFTSSDTNYQNLLGVNNTISTTGNFLLLGNYNGTSYAAGAMTVFHQNNQKIILPAGTFSLGRWQHVALVRESATSLKIYVDGIQAGSATILSTDQYGASDVGYIIASQNGFLNRTLNGYISNLRIVNNTAVYTAAFTPSTTPLTAIANTVLLTCAGNRLRDASTNNLALTTSGNVTVDSFSPFVEPATTRGSGYFDGTGDYLTADANAAFDFGTGDFTVEAWVYPINNGQNFPTFLGSVTGWSAGASGHRFNNTGYANKFWFGLNGSGGVASGDPFMASANTFAFNTWYHYSVSRTGNTFRMFVNGVLENTQTFAGSYNAGLGGLRSGWSTWDGAQGHFTGYVSNLRLIKGTAAYTANFTPPTQSLTAVAGTSLLTLQNNQPTNNSMFVDSSTNNLVITRNGNATQGTFSPYSSAGWSNYFDGTGDYLDLPNNTAFSQTGSWTLELWIYPTVAQNNYVYSQVTSNFLQINISASMFVNIDRSGVGNSIVSANPILLNAWTHIALVSDGTNLRLFINGTQSGSTAAVGTQAASAAVTRIGAYQSNGSLAHAGYISNLRLIKGTAVYTANFTPSTAPLTAVAGTVLLTCADNRFIDDSANNFAITRTGDVRVTNFAPFRAQTQTPRTYSAYFDGTGDFLSVTGTSLDASTTTDYTIEFWMYTIKTPTAQMIYELGAGATNDLQIYVSSDGLAFQVDGNPGTKLFFLDNTWVHVACVKTGTTLTTYLNGQGTVVDTGVTVTSKTTAYIGMRQGTSLPFNGYISNIRVTRAAVYTANFTPATQPLAAITNTSLLTCQSATFVDNSSNRSPITAVGNSQPTLFNPFGFSFANSGGYSVTEHSGSMFFDGTGDYLLSPRSVAIGTGPFTIEGWIYPTALGTQRTIVVNSYWNIGNNGGYRLHLTSSNTIQLQASTGTYNTFPTVITSSTALQAANQWCHIAVVRNSSNSIMIYVNGVAAATAVTYAASLDLGGGQTLKIGGVISDGTLFEPFLGYISNLRILPGTALYTSSFAPPIAPVAPVPGTTLLLNGTAAAITDATTKTVIETVGDARISTVQSKWGGSSIFFDGTGDYLIAPVSPILDFGTDNFTIETWVNFSALTSNRVLLDRWATGNANAWQLYWRATGTSMTFLTGSSTVLVQDPNGANISIGTWNHIAVARSGTTVRLFVNGIVVATNTSSVSFTNTLPLGIGIQTSTLTNPFNGYLQDLRITTGVARYTATFTPPATAFRTK